MKIEALLQRHEGKDLEFKESAVALSKIIQTAVAFANSAGGTLVIGVEDKTKKIVGVKNVLQEEERFASAIADSIVPLLIPLFQVVTYEGKDVLLITIEHGFGPFYVKSKGSKDGVFIRIGSTNRLADQNIRHEISLLRDHRRFDELANVTCPLASVDFKRAKELFMEYGKKFTDKTAYTLDLMTTYQGRSYPTNAAVLLFAQRASNAFPEAVVRMVRFLGNDKTDVLEHAEVALPLVETIDAVLAFIRRNITVSAQFTGEARRKDIYEYPPSVVREAVTNAILHADYATGVPLQVSIYDNRMEITNPGILSFGMTIDDAINGGSRLRNRVIGKVFRELEIIEQWGSGLRRMIDVCVKEGVQSPMFEELGFFFRVTLHSRNAVHRSIKNPVGRLRESDEWQETVVKYLKKRGSVSPKKAQALWKVTSRTTSTRLKKMCDKGLLKAVGSGKFDPYKKFVLK